MKSFGILKLEKRQNKLKVVLGYFGIYHNHKQIDSNLQPTKKFTKSLIF